MTEPFTPADQLDEVGAPCWELRVDEEGREHIRPLMGSTDWWPEMREGWQPLDTRPPETMYCDDLMLECPRIVERWGLERAESGSLLAVYTRRWRPMEERCTACGFRCYDGEFLAPIRIVDTPSGARPVCDPYERLQDSVDAQRARERRKREQEELITPRGGFDSFAHGGIVSGGSGLWQFQPSFSAGIPLSIRDLFTPRSDGVAPVTPVRDTHRVESDGLYSVAVRTLRKGPYSVSVIDGKQILSSIAKRRGEATTKIVPLRSGDVVTTDNAELLEVRPL